jgi:hypothetical protein
MKRLLVFLLFAMPAPGIPGCPVERGAVKLLKDKDLASVNFTPFDAGIKLLNQPAAPSKQELMAANDRRIAPQELQVYRVTGFLVGYKLEADEDFHIVLSDLGDPTSTMVVEMPSEHCMPGGAALRTSWEKRFGKATPRFKKVPARKIMIQVTGYGFFDVIHGQTGVAKNGFEIHPLTDWKEVK